MKKNVFVIHGRDRSMRETVSEYIKSLGLEPVILFKQTNKGNTIIEKIEECVRECSYAVVLLSPDDEGRLRDAEHLNYRARQNVILELGYMWGKLGRDKVAMLYRDNVEKPSDADGIVHIPYYRKSGWREQLKKELEDAGLIKD
jgi:predicted nucleotide-binding protein